MKVWLIEDGEYENTWISAAYDNEEAANSHTERAGGSVLTPVEVHSTLSPDVPDMRLELAERREEWRRHETQRGEHLQRRESSMLTRTIDQYSGLCHCDTFTTPQRTDHGCCRYCSGFAPAVFRAHRGEAALSIEINKLDIHHRIKMRQLCGLPNAERA